MAFASDVESEGDGSRITVLRPRATQWVGENEVAGTKLGKRTRIIARLVLSGGGALSSEGPDSPAEPRPVAT